MSIELLSAMKFAAKRLGADTIVSMLPVDTAVDESRRDEVLERLEQFASDDLATQQELLFDLLYEFPLDSAVAGALVEMDWLSDRPLDLGVLAWDLLNQILFESSQQDVLARLREQMLNVSDLLPPPNVYGILRSGSDLCDWLWDRLVQRSSHGSPVSEAKITGRQGNLDDRSLERLWHAATSTGDVEAALLLFRGEHHLNDEQRWDEVVTSILGRAKVLGMLGLTTYASYQLLILNELAADPEVGGLLADIYLDRALFDQARSVLERIEYPEPDDDVAVGVAARLALHTRDYDSAARILQPYLGQLIDDGDEFCETHSRVICAAVEYGLSVNRESEVMGLFPQLLGLETGDRWASRLKAVLDFEVARRSGDVDDAMLVFANALVHDPADIWLWQIAISSSQTHRVSGSAMAATIALLLQTYPQSAAAWTIVNLGQTLDLQLFARVESSIDERFTAQTAR